MALPEPPEFGGILPSDFQDRGQNFFSPSTKSTKQKPSAYKGEDVCGREVYLVGSHSINIVNDVDCDRVTVGTASLKLTVSAGTSIANMNVLVDTIRDELTAAMAAL